MTCTVDVGVRGRRGARGLVWPLASWPGSGRVRLHHSRRARLELQPPLQLRDGDDFTVTQIGDLIGAEDLPLKSAPWGGEGARYGGAPLFMSSFCQGKSHSCAALRRSARYSGPPDRNERTTKALMRRAMRLKPHAHIRLQMIILLSVKEGSVLLSALNSHPLREGVRVIGMSFSLHGILS